MMKEKLKYLFYMLTHPIDAFYEIRHREKGSVPLALFVVFLAGVAFCMDKRYSSFVVNAADTREVKSLLYIAAMFLLFFLFCVGNWAVTCLTDGEGRLKDIVTATGYALLPLPMFYIPATLISQVIAGDEAVFYTLLIGIAIVWALMLVVMGNMIIHNYTIVKELKTLVLTIVAMVIILFILLLFYSIFRQITEFIKSLYTELIYRM